MKAKLLKRFRRCYEVGRSSRWDYDFVVFDHSRKHVEFMHTSFDVANFCAARMLGMASAFSHETRHYKRGQAKQYYRYAKRRQG